MGNPKSKKGVHMYYQNESDETLVMLTLAGEQNAYEVLVTRYQKLVISAAIRVTKIQFMAEDAAQDAFVTAWMKLDTLQEPEKYGSWVCRIAKNCALNMISRYRSFLPLDVVDNINLSDTEAANPAELYSRSEERNEVNRSIEMLPEKIRQIIKLHYFEDPSIAEIADRMRITEGTVKRQLHNGRKQIRKELCAMNENYSDTLVQRVMKKVEELKLWQTKNDKSGFEKEYGEVLREVEELPECTEKYHALADVLMRGWWWLPGQKNDALFARIADAASEGKNEEVMAFIVTRENSRIHGEALIEFIRDKQIPRLEKAGFVKTLDREWFRLGYNLCREGKDEEGRIAYNKVEEILEKDDAYRILLPNALKMKEILSSDYKDKKKNRYFVGSSAWEYRYIDKELCFWNVEGVSDGYLISIDRTVRSIFRSSSRCDGKFFADISLGGTYVGSDGSTLSYVSDSETVETPAGIFEGCQLWVTKLWDNEGKQTFRTYYKDGVGIVRHEHTNFGITDAYSLKAYNVKTQKGLLPFDEGNTWEYACEYDPETITSTLHFTVSFSSDEKVIITSWDNVIRNKYNEDSWFDMVSQIRFEYYAEKDGRQYLCDVYPAIERAEQLAVTPMEKAHTKATASAVRRILETDTSFNPNYTATGHWNFFSKNMVRKKKDALYCVNSNRWSVAWKNRAYMGDAEKPIYCNDILGILQDATNCIWSDEWRIGMSTIVEYAKWSWDVSTRITCEDGGTITTKAGTFENCLKLCLDISGMENGWSYRGGKKNYYFADGIGIVRTENEYCGGTRTAVYELTSYEGKGEGFMPMDDSLVRRYDALNLTDGFVGAVEYTYVADEDGDIAIFADRTGIREVLLPITQYSAIESEVIEDNLWEAGKYDESRLCHDVNNFQILCHFMGRPPRYWAAPEKAVAWNKYRLKIMEGLGDGVVPDAWLGYYAETSFRTASALFGCGRKDEGYEWLEKTFEAYLKWDIIPDGTELDVGDLLIYGGIKVIKGKAQLKLPNGTKAPISYDRLFDASYSLMYYGMTAPKGWEWFNPVRDEERFKEYIERARKLAEK